MNVIISAYAIGPNQGSESGMAWNWILALSSYCNIYAIVGDEYKSEILNLQNVLKEKGITFYFNCIPEKVKIMASHQGDWRFYWYYKKWQKEAYKIAVEICKNVDIDIVHQLNMVGFREPGYLWKINKPFVWGPIGGMTELPRTYLKDAPFKLKLMLYVKNNLSLLQLKYMPRVNKAFNKASALIAAVPSAQEKIERIKNKESILISETGCYDVDLKIKDKRNRKEFVILWVGRFIYTKRLDIALKTIAKLKHLKNLQFHILGTGTEDQIYFYRELESKLGISNICTWHGRVKNSEVHEMMKNADLFFFTSVLEATSTVIPEAINYRLPILCFDTCGFGPLVSNRIGRKIKMSSPEESISYFKEEIESMYNNKNVLFEMSQNCREALDNLLWKNKAQKVYNVYKEIMEKTSKN